MRLQSGLPGPLRFWAPLIVVLGVTFQASAEELRPIDAATWGDSGKIYNNCFAGPCELFHNIRLDRANVSVGQKLRVFRESGSMIAEMKVRSIDYGRKEGVDMCWLRPSEHPSSDRIFVAVSGCRPI